VVGGGLGGASLPALRNTDVEVEIVGDFVSSAKFHSETLRKDSP